MCDEDGIVINDPVCLRVDDDKFWFSIADSDVLLWAKGIAVAGGFDVNVSEPDASPSRSRDPNQSILCASCTVLMSSME